MATEVKKMDFESQFLQGVQNLPAVTAITGKVIQIYSTTKEYNVLLKYLMETAEKFVKFGAGSVKPFILIFGKPITAVDSFAYEKLMNLEAKYPIITKPPTEIADSSKNIIQEVKSYGVGKVNRVKQYGYDKVHSVLDTKIGKGFIERVDDILIISEQYLDIFLPAGVCESKIATKLDKEPDNTVQRLAVLAKKTQSRFRCLALQQLKQLLVAAETKMEELKAVIMALKEKTVTLTKKYNGIVQNLWKELIKKEEIVDPQNWREKLLHMARLLTQSLSQILKKVSDILSYISNTAWQGFLEAKEQADKLYNIFKSNTKVGEITDAIVTRAQENLQTLQTLVAFLLYRIFNENNIAEDISSEMPEKLSESPADGTVENEEQKVEDSDHSEIDELQMDQL